MTRISTQFSLPVLNNGIGPNHEDHDGQCFDPACQVDARHNHATEYGCLGCVKDYLEKIFPLEDLIANLNINKTGKQLLLMVSNLTPAFLMSEAHKPFHTDSLIVSPMAITAMHLANRGFRNPLKLLFTCLSSLGVVAAQKFAHMPRFLIRPLMALAVFFIEKNGKHVHTEKCNHDHDHEGHNHGSEEYSFSISKPEWIKLAKLQAQINTVPALLNLPLNKLKEMNGSQDSVVKRFFGYVGISALQIVALSLGFVGLGHLIDKGLAYFNVITEDELMAMRAEGAVCACCGAPVCVAEAAAEVGAMSVVA